MITQAHSDIIIIRRNVCIAFECFIPWPCCEYCLSDWVRKLVCTILYSASYHKRPKTTRQQYFAHNFLYKKDKDTKFGTSVLHLFFLYFLKFHTKILIFSTLRFLSVCFIRVFQFSIFWNCFRDHLYVLPNKTRHS